MRTERTVALCGVSEADRAVFASLLNIISFKTSENWLLVDGVDSDVTVVNVDSPLGQRYKKNANPNDAIVEFASENPPPDDDFLCLRKPLRARDILTCLESVSRRTLVDDEDWKMAQGRF